MRDRALFIFWAVSEGRLAWSAASADTRIFHWTSHIFVNTSNCGEETTLALSSNILNCCKLTKLVKVIDISKISSPTISIDKKSFM